MEAVASLGSKSRASFESGMLKSAMEAARPPLEERPEPSDSARLRASCPPEDMARAKACGLVFEGGLAGAAGWGGEGRHREVCRGRCRWGLRGSGEEEEETHGGARSTGRLACCATYAAVTGL